MQDPREILKKVRRIEIRTRRMVTDAMAGHYNSVFKGQGMDFEEVREYAPGDDIRSIDWNVTAKTGKPFVKRFREERELTLMLVVDVSASGDFGSHEGSKRERAAEIASVLAFSAIQNNDKVGLLLFSDQIEAFIPPQKGRQHVLRIIRELLFFEPKSTGTDIPGSLDYLNQVLKRQTVTFLVSDFLVADSWQDLRFTQKQPELHRALRLTQKRHDLILISIHDPRERSLPKLGILTLEDAETGEIFQIDTHSRKVRENYERRNLAYEDQWKSTLKKLGIDAIHIETGQPYINRIREFFLQRERRRH